MDIVLDLRNRYDFSHEDIKSVDVLVEQGNIRNLIYNNPQNEMQARFSMNYCLALALRYGKLSLSDFTPLSVMRPEIRELMSLVNMEAYDTKKQDPDPTVRLPHKVTITKNNGQTLIGSCKYARGTIHNLLRPGDLPKKFKDCCYSSLSPENFVGSQSKLEKIMELESVHLLTQHLAFDV